MKKQKLKIWTLCTFSHEPPQIKIRPPARISSKISDDKQQIFLLSFSRSFYTRIYGGIHIIPMQYQTIVQEHAVQKSRSGIPNLKWVFCPCCASKVMRMCISRLWKVNTICASLPLALKPDKPDCTSYLPDLLHVIPVCDDTMLLITRKIKTALLTFDISNPLSILQSQHRHLCHTDLVKKSLQVATAIENSNSKFKRISVSLDILTYQKLTLITNGKCGVFFIFFF